MEENYPSLEELMEEAPEEEPLFNVICGGCPFNGLECQDSEPTPTMLCVQVLGDPE